MIEPPEMALITEVSGAEGIGVLSEEVPETFLVASSFEPRSLRTTELVKQGTFAHAVVFDYEDTLDTVMGRHHRQSIRSLLDGGKAERVNVLPCNYADPFSSVRGLNAFIGDGGLKGGMGCVTVDATCFTKLHLLLLLRYLHADRHVERIRICYTEPLAYATAFGRQLSYGVRRTVYVPYQLREHRSSRVGLIAFLGHERLRLERIVQELEPELSVIVFGEPGFARNMEDESRRVNESIFHRASYDRQYRVVSAPAGDLRGVFEVLKQQLELVLSQHCDTVYLAALGTKVQALGFELLRRAEYPIRMLLAYSIPRSYERNMYSQGSGRTHVAVLQG